MDQSSGKRKKYWSRVVWFLCIILLSQNLYAKKKTVFTIGDSTMAEKSPNTTERGWGMLFSSFVNTDQVQVKNYGKNGRSTKSFIDEGWWTTVLDSLRPGDFVLIQFGHNDEKTDVSLHTDPATSFRENLKKFVYETREKGATPILLTSIVRRSFDADENMVDSHGDFPQATRETARQLKVQLIDIELKTRLMENIAGWIGTHKIHQFEPPKEIDNTHLCNFGAYVVARMVSEDIRKQNISIPLNANPALLTSASDNTLDLAYDYFADNIQSAQKTLSSLSSASGHSDFSTAIGSAQSEFDKHAFESLKEIGEATKKLRFAERTCRWTQFAPFDATFAIGNASFEEGAGWNSKVGANIPLAWQAEAKLINGRMIQKNTNASDGYFCYSIAADTGSSTNFYQDITLPVGEYTLTVDLKPNTGSNTRLYSKIGDQTDSTLAPGPYNSWETISVNFAVPVDNATVQLGVSASATIEIDNFKLMKIK
ncbi:MAG: rhamnogalacturonan acetylesterase [Bacteroidota bacterium]|nr:rhamnogalacturonan acetylesterase [Bacteroidota bacterium]